MKLTRTRHLLPRVEWLDSIDSTNAALRELCERESEAVPHGTIVATANQTCGRGRLGRGWVTPPSTALAVSVLVRGDWSGQTENSVQDRAPLPISWLPLLAGSAVAATLQPLFQGGGGGYGGDDSAGSADGDGTDIAAPNRVGVDGAALNRVGVDRAAPKRVGVKWPNDVHVRDEAEAEAGSPGHKLCGILCEVVPGAGSGQGGDTSQGSDAVIVGMGINLLIPEWQLPTERSTSVLAAGGDVGDAEDLDDAAGQDLADRVLAGVARELLRLCEQARSDPRTARARVLRHSLTLGTEVRVHLPGGEIVDGRASALAADGSLVVDLPTGGRLEVSAADVEHLR